MEATESFQKFLPVIDDIRNSAKSKPEMDKALKDLDKVARDVGMDPDEYLFLIVKEFDQIREARAWVQTKFIK